MRLINIVILLISVSYLKGQSVNFTTVKSLNEAREIARRESKIIFIDCFATWCQPCKRMDKEVFLKPNIADFLNSKFVNIKVNCDLRTIDSLRDPQVFELAKLVTSSYGISGYPTLLFINEDGKLKNRINGYAGEERLLKESRKAIDPKFFYEDPKDLMNGVLEKGKGGKLELKDFAYLFKTAWDLKLPVLTDSLMEVLWTNLNLISKDTLFTKEVIEIVGTNLKASSSSFFKFFVDNFSRIDFLMKRRNYANSVIDRIIEKEYLAKLLGSINGGSLKDSSLVDWNKIDSELTSKIGNKHAKRSLTNLKREYYYFKGDMSKCIEIGKLLIDNNEIDLADPLIYSKVNSYAWVSFLNSVDKSTLEFAAESVLVVINQSPVIHRYRFIDTYANLLYKMYKLGFGGNVENAIWWEEQAINSVSDFYEKNPSNAVLGVKKNLLSCLNKMKTDVQTW